MLDDTQIIISGQMLNFPRMHRPVTCPDLFTISEGDTSQRRQSMDSYKPYECKQQYPYQPNDANTPNKTGNGQTKHRNSCPGEIFNTNNQGNKSKKDSKKKTGNDSKKNAGNDVEKNDGKDATPRSNPPTYTSQVSVARDATPEQAHEHWNLPKERKSSHHKNGGKFEERFMKACRLALYVFLFVVIHATGVCSLLELYSLTTEYATDTGEDKEDAAVGLIICMGFASMITFLANLWRSLFQDRERLLKRKTALVVSLEVISTVGEISLVMNVLPNMSSSSATVLLLTISIVPSFLRLIQFSRRLRRYLRKFERSETRCTLALVWSLISSFVSFGATVAALTVVAIELTLEYSVILLATVFLRSVGYWESFLLSSNLFTDKKTTEPEGGDKKQTIKEDNIGKCLRSFARAGLLLILVALIKFHVRIPYLTGDFNNEDFIDTGADINENNITLSPLQPNQTTPLDGRDATTKALWLNHVEDSSTELGWILEFYSDNKHTVRMVLLIITFPYFASVACRLQMQRLAFTLPLFLVPFSTYAITYFACGERSEIQDTLGIVLTCSHNAFEDVTWEIGWGAGLAVAMAMLLWYHLFPDIERMAKYERLYTNPPRSGILPFFDVIFNRKNDMDGKADTDAGSSTDSSSKPAKPDIYICCTMWHETKREMQQLLKSLFKLDGDLARRRAFYSETHDKSEDPDDVNACIHVVFDNAFEYTKNGTELNEWVLQFLECLENEARDTYSQCKHEGAWRYRPYKTTVPYGGRLTFVLPGETQLTVHLKDKKKVRIKKRWSQVLYMYYTLLFGQENLSTEQLKQKLKNSFIFTLDGDVDFEPKAVRLLMDRMKKNPDVGAVCGRIHPIGSGPMIWYQQFEYAVGHWLQKASEHVFGCVLCCPGCFSLFRGSALVDDNVLKTYTREPEEGVHLVQFEQGEDRWLCTLLLKRGYKIDYCAGADAKTYAPEDFFDFFIQRRRWSPSTLANMIDLINSWGEIVKNNNQINHLFMFYQFVMVATSLIAPATVIILIAGSFSTVLHIGPWKSFLVAITPVSVFAVSCLLWKQSKQLILAGILSAIYTFVMVIVTIGMILSIVSESIFEPNVLFLIFVGGIFIIAGLLHPKEFSCLFGGLLYYVTVPSTFIFLTVFFVFNMNDVSWGTREKKTEQAEAPVEKSLMVLVKDYVKKLLMERIEPVLRENGPLQNEHVQGSVEEDQNSPSASDQKSETYWLNTLALKGFKTKEPVHEIHFWENIINRYLKPLETNKKLQEKFRTELVELRNKCVFGFIMANLMLAMALLQLQVSREQLQGFYILGRYEPVSTACLIVFAMLIIVQVLGMLKHIWGTFLHLMSATELREKEMSFDQMYKEFDSELIDDVIEEPPADYDELAPDYSDDDGNNVDGDNPLRQPESVTAATAETRPVTNTVETSCNQSRKTGKRPNIYATRVNRAIRRRERADLHDYRRRHNPADYGNHGRRRETTYRPERGSYKIRQRFPPAYHNQSFREENNHM